MLCTASVMEEQTEMKYVDSCETHGIYVAAQPRVQSSGTKDVEQDNSVEIGGMTKRMMS